MRLRLSAVALFQIFSGPLPIPNRYWWTFIQSMDWLKGKHTGNHTVDFPMKCGAFPVKFPLNQSIDTRYSASLHKT